MRPARGANHLADANAAREGPAWLFVEWNTPSAVIEFFWIAISLYGLVKRPRAG